MTRLSDTQLVILSAASQRDDLSILPLPDSLTLKGGALNKVMDSLRNRGLIRVIRTDDDRPDRLVLTSEGMAAIGVEPEDDAPEGATPADAGATLADAAVQGIDAAPVTGADGAATPAQKGKTAKRQGDGSPRRRRRASPRPAPARSRRS